MRRREQGFTLIEIMVVIAIIAGLIGTVAVVVPGVQDRQKRLTCQQNLGEFGRLFVQKSLEKIGRVSQYDGASVILQWRKMRTDIIAGKESVLLCPGDTSASTAGTEDEIKKKYDEIDLTNPADGLTSYAVRDFTTYPRPAEEKELEIFACDRQGPDGRVLHHKGGVNVVYCDAQVKFLDRELLGLTADQDPVVGPDSGHNQLKKVVYRKGAKKD